MRMEKDKNKDKNKKEEYKEGVKKTTIPFLFGIFAGLFSFLLSNPLKDTGLLIVLLMILMQKYIYPLLHTSVKGVKDWLYISLLTFLCWFISFTLLLNLAL